jgi:hypothetical protein
MPRLFKFTVASALLTLAFAGLCFMSGYKGLGLLWPVLLMPVLWILWLVCVLFDTGRKTWKLILLWILIDIAVLGALTLLVANMNRASGADGMDYVLVIAFSPLILPVMLVSAFFPVVGNGLFAITRGVSYLLPSGLVGVLSDWLGCSILSAISSCLVVSLCYFWKTARGRKRTRTERNAI